LSQVYEWILLFHFGLINISIPAATF